MIGLNHLRSKLRYPDRGFSCWYLESATTASFRMFSNSSFYHPRYMDLVWETDRVWSHMGAREKGNIVISDWRFERKGSLWKRISVRMILKWILIKVPDNCILSAVWRAWKVLSPPEGRARMGGEVFEIRRLKSIFWPRNKEARITPRFLINDQTIICIIHHIYDIMEWNNNNKKSNHAVWMQY